MKKWLVRAFALNATLWLSGCAFLMGETVEATSEQGPPVTEFFTGGSIDDLVDQDGLSREERGLMYSLVDYALRLKGVRYSFGGDSPDKGFDCSGFIRYVFAREGIFLPRQSAVMAQVLPQVAYSARQPGDLVFFKIGGGNISHVGLYVGDDQFVHATSSRTGRVMVSDLNLPYWRKRLVSVRRPQEKGRYAAMGGELFPQRG